MTTNWVGRKLGGFVVERVLGEGGMGMVALACQESLSRQAVLKRIHPRLGTDEELEARFEREAVAAARLHHPNVVGVYDRFVVRGDTYIATEFVDGFDLSEVLMVEARLPWRIAGMIALEIARGLEAIHATGTLHRDIKPQNILIGRQGQVKITDFGLALDGRGTPLTQPGIAVGTPPYMSPEQLRGERLDPKADLFALGCIFYEIMVGHPPYPLPKEDEDATLLARVESGKFESLQYSCKDVPRSIARLVRNCLQPRSARRIASAKELRGQLERRLGHPSSRDCQGQLATYFWDRHVFEPRATETIVMVAQKSNVRPTSRARTTATLGVLTVLLILLGLTMREPTKVSSWTLSVMSESGLSPQNALKDLW